MRAEGLEKSILLPNAIVIKAHKQRRPSITAVYKRRLTALKRRPIHLKDVQAYSLEEKSLCNRNMPYCLLSPTVLERCYIVF